MNNQQHYLTVKQYNNGLFSVIQSFFIFIIVFTAFFAKTVDIFLNIDTYVIWKTIEKGGTQMRKKTYKKTSIRKPVISILLCIFLVATSLSSMIGASINTSEGLVRNHSNDETNYLTYTFSFREPELKQTTLCGTSYSKIVLSGAMNIGKKATSYSISRYDTNWTNTSFRRYAGC